MALTSSEELRLQAIEQRLNQIQEALNQLTTKRQMKSLLNIRQSEINDLKSEIQTLQQTGGGSILLDAHKNDVSAHNSLFNEKAEQVHNHNADYYQKTEFITTSTGSADAGKPIALDGFGRLDDSLIELDMEHHGALSGLEDDDHTQYVLADGSRHITSDLTVLGNVLADDPLAATHAATKGYVDNLVQGLDWQDSVLDIDLAGPPGGEIAGDRYIVNAPASGEWLGHENDIATFDDPDWSFKTPDEGAAAWVEDKDSLYVFNSTDWVQFGSSSDHGALSGRLDDDHPQYLLVDGTRSMAGALNLGGNNIVSAKRITLAPSAGDYLYFIGRAVMYAPADGVFKLTDNAGTGFERLQFGGETNAFPALKRSGTTLSVRLADDSGPATLSTGTINADGNLRAGGFNRINWNGRSEMTSPLDGEIQFTNDAGTGFDRLYLGAKGDVANCAVIERAGAGIRIEGGTGSLTNLTCKNTTVTGDGTLEFQARSKLYSPINGNIQLTNSLGDDFGLLQFGGTTNLFPALKRSTDQIWARLADDSNWATFSCGNMNVYTRLWLDQNRQLVWNGRSRISSPADGQVQIINNAANQGIIFDTTTNGELYIITEASGNAKVAASVFTDGGSAFLQPSTKLQFFNYTACYIENPGRGDMYIRTEDFSSAREAGSIYVQTANHNNSGNFASGNVELRTGNTQTDGNSGSVILETGVAGAGEADAGSVSLRTHGIERMSVSGAGDISVLGNKLMLDADSDTYLDASVDDQINIFMGGAIQAQFTASGLSVAFGGGNIWASQMINAGGPIILNPSNGLVMFNSTTSAYPALKRDGASLRVRLADDSAYANFYAAAVVADGDVSGNQWLGSSNVRAGGSSEMYWNTRSRMSSPVDGNVLLTDNAATSFGLLQFGGTTSAFPSLKRSGAGLQVRLSDDTGYTGIDAGSYSVGGVAGASGSFTTNDGKTVTVTNGIITSIV